MFRLAMVNVEPFWQTVYLGCVLVIGWRGRWEKLVGDDKNKKKLRARVLCGHLHCVELPEAMTELGTEENYEYHHVRGCGTVTIRSNDGSEEGMVVKTTGAEFFLFL